METLNKQLVVTYITAKQAEYRKRRDVANAGGDIQLSGDYKLKLMLLDNWLLRINNGEFDVLSVKSEPVE
jgi:hypothetical protein